MTYKEDEVLEKMIELEESFRGSSRKYNIVKVIPTKIESSTDFERFGEELNRYLTEGQEEFSLADYCLNIEGVESLSAGALNELCSFNIKHRAVRSKPIALVNLTPRVLGTIKTLSLDTVWHIYDTAQEYKEAVSA